MTDYKDRVSGWATDIDWSKAQDSDTHYDPMDRVFVNFDAMHDWDRKLIQRPAPQWSGDGLPPVGTFVRIADDGSLRYGSNESGEVIAHVEDCAVVRMSYGLGCFTARFLEAIKTPAQIAADAREAAIDEMAGWAGVTGLPIDRERKIMGRLYDARYRRMPEGEDQ